MELNDEQIAKLTPEQITEYEDNPEAREKILASLKATEETEETPEQEEEEDAANGEGEADESEEEEQDEPEQEEEPVVLTKSGKATIPYEKHKELRMEVASLRDKLAGMEKTKAELETLKARINAAPTHERRSEIQKKLEERIATMKEDFPDIGNSMDDFNQMFSDLVEQIESDKAEAKAKAEELGAPEGPEHRPGRFQVAGRVGDGGHELVHRGVHPEGQPAEPTGAEEKPAQ